MNEISKSCLDSVEPYVVCAAIINTNAVVANYQKIASLVNPETKCSAVVKADAYGHGATQVAKKLKDKADFFAVATAREGMELRENGIENPILVLSYCAPAEYDLILKYGITPTEYAKSVR